MPRHSYRIYQDRYETFVVQVRFWYWPFSYKEVDAWDYWDVWSDNRPSSFKRNEFSNPEKAEEFAYNLANFGAQAWATENAYYPSVIKDLGKLP